MSSLIDIQPISYSFLLAFRFDSIVNFYLIRRCSLDPSSSEQIGLVVHSHCDYFQPTGFPAILDIGLRVNKLGKSSVTYEIGVFEESVEGVKAVGEFIHVFVDRDTRVSGVDGMNSSMRNALARISITDHGKL